MSSGTEKDFLNVEQRIAICREIPLGDWNMHPGRHVAVSALTKRILGGDDDELALAQRISAQYPDDQIFIAPGKKKRFA